MAVENMDMDLAMHLVLLRNKLAGYGSRTGTGLPTLFRKEFPIYLYQKGKATTL